MLVKIVNTVLILLAVFMGLKQGYAMLTAKPDLFTMFGKWGFSKTGLMLNGAVTLLAALLLLFPKTFIWGNFIMAAGILLILCFHLMDKDIKGVAVELPFFALNLVIIYLQHPLKNA